MFMNDATIPFGVFKSWTCGANLTISDPAKKNPIISKAAYLNIDKSPKQSFCITLYVMRWKQNE